MPAGMKRTLEEFVSLSQEVHHNKYNYDKVKYMNNTTSVIITCPLHGDFEQLPKCHLKGSGCNECSKIDAANKRIAQSKEKFFNEIQIIDNEHRWDYTEVIFNGTNENVILKCNGCGNKTNRTPYKHLHEFQPCKRSCFVTRPVVFELNDVVNIDNDEIIVVEPLEEWKPFPEDTNYIVSNKGYIKNSKGKIIKGSLDKTAGYIRTGVQAYYMHTIVAKTFLPNPENKPTVNHKNKNRIDNRVTNLEWSTYAEQNEHKNNAPKTYTSHNNGKRLLRINKTTNELIETYDTLMLAAKWIMEHIHKTDTVNKNIEQQLRSISSSLSQKIKRSKNNYFGYNCIWKYEEPILDKNEYWKPIIGIEKDGYFVSNIGRIKNPSNIIKTTFGIAGGYYDLKIVAKGKHHKLHRLVALAFVENPENKPFVNHKNGNKLDNSAVNLEWVTNQENVQHAYDTGLHQSGVSPIIQYDLEGNVIQEFNSIRIAADQLNIGQGNISACCRGITKTSGGFQFKYKFTQ